MAELIDIKQDFDLGNRFTLDTAKEMAKILDDKYRIVVKYDSQTYHCLNDKVNIFISCAREIHQMPNQFDDLNVHFFLHNYAPLNHWWQPIENPRIIPMPLGPFVDDMVSKCESIKPFSEREYDFCFVGQLPHTGNRDKFKRCLDKMLEETGDKFKYYVRYTTNFGEGLSSDEYAELLNNSRVSLCPAGATSCETFRFFESLVMGAFPMVELLPSFWYYQRAPMFFSRWEFLDNALSKTLNFLSKSENNYPFKILADYNQTVLNPTNLAKILTDIIDERLHTN